MLINNTITAQFFMKKKKRKEKDSKLFLGLYVQKVNAGL